MLYDFSWAFMNRVVKTFKKKNTLDIEDFDPDFTAMRAKQMGTKFS